ncbi:MAG: hypothetical protein AAGB29_09160 [Planctomycetota bacterium]
MSRKRRLVPFAITALVLVTLTVPLAYVTAPYVKRSIRLRDLAHEERARRELAMAYAARHLTHPVHGEVTRAAVFDGLVSLHQSNRNTAFDELLSVAELGGVWTLEQVPLPVWIAWIERLAFTGDVETRIRACWLLADLPDEAYLNFPEIDPYLASDSLAMDVDESVALNMAAAATELAGDPQLRSLWQERIGIMANPDTTPVLFVERPRLIALVDSIDSGPAVEVSEALPATPIGELLAGLSSNDAGLQALALTCLRLGATPIDDAEQADLAAALLRSFDPVERRAGALLAGATGTHGDLLEERLTLAPDYTEVSLIRLGLWLQGREASGWDPALLLVTPEVLPMPLVRWGLVVPTLLLEPSKRTEDQRRVAAATLDGWLVPRGDLPDGLVDELFDEHGWPAMAPLTAWVGAVPGDADSRELAAERLRDHWLVTRRRFLAGPGTAEASR